MANEFIARNGLIAQTDSKISGSLTQGSPGNIASGSYSHAEGGGYIVSPTPVDISNLTFIGFSSAGINQNVFSAPTTTEFSIVGSSSVDFPELPLLPFSMYPLYLFDDVSSFTVNSNYYSTPPIVTSASYDSVDNYTTLYLTSSPLQQVYYDVTGGTNTALGDGSHAEGLGTIAKGNFQHVQGQFNKTSSVQSAFIHGNGTSDSARSNLIYAHDSVVEITGSLNITGSLLVNGVEPGGGGSGAGFPYSGSAVITGSLLVSGSGLTVTGSLEVSGSITGSLLGTSSFATSSSRAATASYSRYPYITVTTTGNTAAGSLPNTDYIYLVNGTHTVTLPTAVGNTSRYDIKNIGTGTASIATFSSQTIDTSTPPITLLVRYTSLTLISNGTSWNII